MSFLQSSRSSGAYVAGRDGGLESSFMSFRIEPHNASSSSDGANYTRIMALERELVDSKKLNGDLQFEKAQIAARLKDTEAILEQLMQRTAKEETDRQSQAALQPLQTLSGGKKKGGAAAADAESTTTGGWNSHRRQSTASSGLGSISGPGGSRVGGGRNAYSNDDELSVKAKAMMQNIRIERMEARLEIVKRDVAHGVEQAMKVVKNLRALLKDLKQDFQSQMKRAEDIVEGHKQYFSSTSRRRSSVRRVSAADRKGTLSGDGSPIASGDEKDDAGDDDDDDTAGIIGGPAVMAHYGVLPKKHPLAIQLRGMFDEVDTCVATMNTYWRELDCFTESPPKTSLPRRFVDPMISVQNYSKMFAEVTSKIRHTTTVHRYKMLMGQPNQHETSQRAVVLASDQFKIKLKSLYDSMRSLRAAIAVRNHTMSNAVRVMQGLHDAHVVVAPIVAEYRRLSLEHAQACFGTVRANVKLSQEFCRVMNRGDDSNGGVASESSIVTTSTSGAFNQTTGSTDDKHRRRRSSGARHSLAGTSHGGEEEEDLEDFDSNPLFRTDIEPIARCEICEVDIRCGDCVSRSKVTSEQRKIIIRMRRTIEAFAGRRVKHFELLGEIVERLQAVLSSHKLVPLSHTRHTKDVSLLLQKNALSINSNMYFAKLRANTKISGKYGKKRKQESNTKKSIRAQKEAMISPAVIDATSREHGPASAAGGENIDWIQDAEILKSGVLEKQSKHTVLDVDLRHFEPQLRLTAPLGNIESMLKRAQLEAGSSGQRQDNDGSPLADEHDPSVERQRDCYDSPPARASDQVENDGALVVKHPAHHANDSPVAGHVPDKQTSGQRLAALMQRLAAEDTANSQTNFVMTSREQAAESLYRTRQLLLRSHQTRLVESVSSGVVLGGWQQRGTARVPQPPQRQSISAGGPRKRNTASRDGSASSRS